MLSAPPATRRKLTPSTEVKLQAFTHSPSEERSRPEQLRGRWSLRAVPGEQNEPAALCGWKQAYVWLGAYHQLGV